MSEEQRNNWETIIEDESKCNNRAVHTHLGLCMVIVSLISFIVIPPFMNLLGFHDRNVKDWSFFSTLRLWKNIFCFTTITVIYRVWWSCQIHLFWRESPLCLLHIKCNLFPLFLQRSKHSPAAQDPLQFLFVMLSLDLHFTLLSRVTLYMFFFFLIDFIF